MEEEEAVEFSPSTRKGRIKEEEEDGGNRVLEDVNLELASFASEEGEGRERGGRGGLFSDTKVTNPLNRFTTVALSRAYAQRGGAGGYKRRRVGVSSRSPFPACFSPLFSPLCSLVSLLA